MSQFPRLPFISPGARKHSKANSARRLRSWLALSQLALLLLASFSLTTSAQQPGNSKQSGAPTSSDAFMVYQQKDGTVGCRVATPAEKQELDKINPSGLHQINHLQPETDGPDATTTPGLKIILDGTTQLESFPEAKAAFIRAAATWEAQVQDSITIIIRVDYGPTNFGQAWGANILGSTRDQSNNLGTNFYNNVRTKLIQNASSPAETTLYNQLPFNNVPTNLGGSASLYVSVPILRALGMMNAAATPQDSSFPQVGFNSNFQYDFDPSNGIDSTKTDFEAVATHEIGHVLGFTSFAGLKELQPTQPLAFTIWDIFRFAPGTSLGTFSSASRFLSSGDTPSGNPVFWAGGSDVKVSTGRPDGTGGDGEQSSHWKDDLGVTANYIGIMDPTISRGRHLIVTANDLLALDSFGYHLTGAGPPTPTPPPANNDFAGAQTISGCTGNVSGTNAGANKEAGEPSHSPDNDPGSASVWYQWQAPSNSSVTITTAGSDFDTELAVYTGNSVSALTPIAKNDDVTSGSVVTSSVTFTATAGTLYRIAVDGYSSNINLGSITLNWNALNCSVPAANPIDGAQFFVAQHYRDFLGREADAAGLQYWSEQISGNASNNPSPCATGNAVCEHIRRISVSAAFFVENEFQRTGGFVYRFYKASYGTRPTYQQFNNDRSLVPEGPQLEAEKQAFATGWVQRPAFIAKYPASLNTGPAFVDALLLNVQQNSGVNLSGQRASLLNDYTAGGRAQVVRSVVDNATFTQAEYNAAFVLMQYFGYLQRDADDSGYQFWLGILNNQAANNYRAMVCAFITSGEYQQRFGTTISRSNNDCSFVGP